MAKPKFYTADVSIYEHKVLCFVTRDPEALQEAVNLLNLNINVKKEHEKISSGNGGLCWYGDRHLTIIWMGQKPTSPQHYSILAHECIHAGVQLLHAIGVPIEATNDEVLAYLVDSLVQQFLTEMRKR